MPQEGCHNLHRWQKEQSKCRQSGKPPSDPSVPGLLGFEKEQDLQETKVYVRALWLATENARASAPKFLDNNVCKLWSRTQQIVAEYIQDEDKLCAELAKDDIIQIDAEPSHTSHSKLQPCFLKQDVEHILINEGFGALIWGRHNHRASQLINPRPGDGEKAPKWRNQQDEIVLTVRYWVAARIQNKIRSVAGRRGRHKMTKAPSVPKKKLGRPRKVEQEPSVTKPDLESSRCAQCRKQNRQCHHNDLHQLMTPNEKRHDSPNEQLAGEIRSSSIRRRNIISVPPILDEESWEYIDESEASSDESEASTDESPSKVQSKKRRRSVSSNRLQLGTFEQLEDDSASERDNRKHILRTTARNSGHDPPALNLEPRWQVPEKLLPAPTASQTVRDTHKHSRHARQNSECSNGKVADVYSQALDMVNSTDDGKSIAPRMDSTEPTSECSSVDFTRLLDADDELSEKEGGDVTAKVRATDNGEEGEHRLVEPVSGNSRHSYSPNTHSLKDTATSLLDQSHTSTPSPSTNPTTQVASARRALRNTLSHTLSRNPYYRSTLTTLIPLAKRLYELLTLHSPACFPPAFEENELALVYWEALMTKFLTQTPLHALKEWHRELLVPWPDRRGFGLEIWSADLVRFFVVLLGEEMGEVCEDGLMDGLVEYNTALWECFVS